MSDQNKNTGTAEDGTISKPASADNSGAKPSTETREQTTTDTPDHEQGREHIPNVVAQDQAADIRRTAEQSHIPKASADNAVTAGNSTADRKENPVTSTGQAADDAKRTMAEGQGERKPGNDPVKPGGNTSNSDSR